MQGGFIVGFDSDEPSIFQRQIDFIQQSGIVTAMVGLLQAIPGTGLYNRLQREGRLLGVTSGDNVDGTTNLVPRMNAERLRQGYLSILKNIYAPKEYYGRIRTFLREYKVPKEQARLQFQDVLAFARSIWHLGIWGKGRLRYWGLLAWTQFCRPELLPVAMTLAILGYHYRKVCRLHVLKDA